jgi:hypothetical protein
MDLKKKHRPTGEENIKIMSKEKDEEVDIGFIWLILGTKSGQSPIYLLIYDVFEDAASSSESIALTGYCTPTGLS